MSDRTFDDPPGEPKSPKEKYEDELLEGAMAPWKRHLTADQADGMALVMELLIKTHPVMQKKIVRSLKNKTSTEAPKAVESAASAMASPGGTERMGSPPALTTETTVLVTERTAPDASGIVEQRGIVPSPGERKAGGE